MSDPTYKRRKAAEVGARIALRRARASLSQAKLALTIGKTPGAVGQYETGHNLPSLETLERIALALGTTVEWLLTGDDPVEIRTAQTVNELAALKLVREVPADQQGLILKMLAGAVAHITKA